MRFKVLGPLEVWADDVSVPLGPRKQRLLLAIMLCHQGQVLSKDELIDALWNGSPPRFAAENLRLYVSGLRQVVGSQILARQAGGGYVLLPRPNEIDSVEFVETLEQARPVLAAGDARVARELIGRALGLWRGRAYLEFDDVPVLVAERARLEAHWVAAVEDGIAADLQLGRESMVIPQLADLVNRYPYRERFATQLMVAYYRCGRQADALATYRRAHRILTQELGVDPQPEMSQVHEAILRGAEDLGPYPAVGLGGPGNNRPVPAQVPAGAAVFAGRAAELAALTYALGAESATGRIVAISAVAGAGGIGKTWLALRWAHQHRERFPDGQLFVNLRGFDPSGEPVRPATALHGFLDALGVAPAAIPADPDAQVGLYRSLIADRRMLIILDNARDSEQVAPLLPGAGSCAVIVTSRDRLLGLVSGYGAQPVPLDVLDHAQSRDLLVRRLGERRLAAEPAAATALIDRCGGLPLALGIAAARAAVAPHLPLAVIAKELTDAATRLTGLDEEHSETGLRAVLSWSYTALTPAFTRVFDLLGLAPGPDISLLAAAALTGLPIADAAAALRALERQSLLTQHVVGRWRMHDLVRLYAAERASREVPGAERAAAARRLVDFYLHTAYTADRLLAPHRMPISLENPTHPTGSVDPPDRAAAMAWLAAEHLCLLAAQEHAAERGWNRAVWQLAWTLTTFHGRRGNGPEELTAWLRGLAAAKRDGDPVAEARGHRCLGQAYVRLGRHAEAAAHLDHALAYAERVDDQAAQAHANSILAYAWSQRGDDRQALIHGLRTLHIYQALNRSDLEPQGRNMVGWFLTRLGRYDEARDHLEVGLTLSRRHGNRAAEADILDSLGYLAHQTGRHTEARDHYRQALVVLNDIGHSYNEAECFERLGDSYAASNDPDPARDDWNQALVRYRSQHRTADADRVQRRLEQLPERPTDRH